MNRLILRSEETQGQKLREALEGELAKIDLKTLVDRNGHSPLTYAVYKEKEWAARVLIEHVKNLESTNDNKISRSDVHNDSEATETGKGRSKFNKLQN